MNTPSAPKTVYAADGRKTVYAADGRIVIRPKTDTRPDFVINALRRLNLQAKANQVFQ